MRLERIVLHEVVMRLKEPFRTPAGSYRDRRFLVVEACAEGACGFGEVAVLSAPYYNEETAATAWHVLESYLVPIALSRPWERPEELAAAFRPIKRHYMAKAGLEAAVWDLCARLRGIPLARILGGERRRVEAGVAVGIETDTASLIRTVGRYLAEGYRRVKVKIRPGWDEAPLRALRDAFGDFPLMADANSAYTLADVERLRRLDDLGLMMIEQPLAADDIVDHARLQAELATPICLDESIHSVDDARRALELGSCRVINVKAARVGGLSEARRLHDYCRERGVPIWCGGLLESGIGRAHNLALSSLPHFMLPGDLSASSRYWEADLIEPEIVVGADGLIQLPDGAGIGYAVRRDRLDAWTVRRRAFTADAAGGRGEASRTT